MEYRSYKDSDEKISLLGFGCMRLPKLHEDSQEIDKVKATAMVDHALASGINYFDTAYPYHEGLSEGFVGEALSARHPRHSFKLATKLPTWQISSQENVESIFNEQLKKCQVEYFDYYLIHNLGKANFTIAEQFGIFDLLKKKQQQGLIGHLGFSFHDQPPLLQKIVDAHKWDFAQIQLNYMDWELQDARQQYEILKRNDIPIIVMEPIRGGSLATLSERAVAILKQADAGASPASWALRYAASLPGVLTVLSGMSNMAQLEDNLKTINNFRPLNDAEHATIDQALNEYRLSGAIPCTACRYCMDCPAGVDIPKVIAIYNRHCTGENDMVFQLEYRVLGEDKQAEHCVQCNMCAEQCPQVIDIPHWMKVIDQYAKEVDARQA